MADEHGADLNRTSDQRSSDAQINAIVASLIAFQERHLATQEKLLRRDLRWRNVRVGLIAIALVMGPLIYTFGLNHLLSPERFNEDYVAQVRIDGLIAPEQRANAQAVNAALRKAFEDEDAQGVVILINSTGGTPVQSALIHDRILALRKEFPDKKTVVVGEDQMTSGAYLVAAADKIFVNRSTQTGSIGVVMSGWGLHEVLERYRIERRLFTAGENKARLDMFQPLKPEDQAKVQRLLAQVHTQFIEAVKASRGERLRVAEPEVFSGDFWTGEEALAMGLVDGLSDLASVLEAEFGVKRAKDFTPPPSLWQNLENSLGVLTQGRFSTPTYARAMLLP